MSEERLLNARDKKILVAIFQLAPAPTAADLPLRWLDGKCCIKLFETLPLVDVVRGERPVDRQLDTRPPHKDRKTALRLSSPGFFVCRVRCRVGPRQSASAAQLLTGVWSSSPDTARSRMHKFHFFRQANEPQ